jgi:alkylation response protein AidB-like acyl-CoA dehydrogenase
MDFSYNEVQTEFRASLRRFFAERGGHVAKAEPRQIARNWRAAWWTELAELGALAALLPEEYEGMGGDSTDVIAILDEAGRSQAGPPIIENAIIAAGLIHRLGSPRQKQDFLPAIAAGRLRFAFADGDILAPGGADPAFKLTGLETSKYRVEGRQAIVTEAPECDHLLLLCGGLAPGSTLFYMPRAHQGVLLQPFWTLDDRPAASLILDGVELDAAARIGGIGGADAAVSAVLDLACIAQCAEAAESDDRAFENPHPVRPALGEFPGVAASAGGYGRGVRTQPVLDV